MYDKNKIDLRITIDTAYGFISKYAETSVKDITKEEILDEYLTQTFSTIKRVVIEDFKHMKILQKASECEGNDDLEN